MNFPKEKKMKMNLTSTSKFVSLILRHKPETIGIQLDEHGWENVDYRKMEWWKCTQN